MSTGNSKIYRKIKKINEKDKRMAQLEKEIARLENENSKLKRDSIGYESRLAAFSGATRVASEFPSLNRGLQPETSKRVSLQKPENDDEDEDVVPASRSKNISDDGAKAKKKIRMKLLKSSKKKDTKKWGRSSFSVDIRISVHTQNSTYKGGINMTLTRFERATHRIIDRGHIHAMDFNLRPIKLWNHVSKLNLKIFVDI